MHYYNINKRLWLRFLFVLTVGLSTGCKKYLDAKPDKKLVVPTTLSDASALLDYYTRLNAFYTSMGSQSDDDFYILDDYYNTIEVKFRDRYIWNKDALSEDADWSDLYSVVQYANLALETVEKNKPSVQTLAEWNRVKGEALFFRAYAFYQIAQYYAVPYDPRNAEKELGIPLRLTSDVNAQNVRSNLEDTWQQILKDYKEASLLLPTTSDPISRPNRKAAFAAMARTFLVMQDYKSAYMYADSSLQLYHTLLDYNQLDTSSSAPFPRFNEEEVFHSEMIGAGMLGVTHWRVDSLLYQSYAHDDLRRLLFFKGIGSNPYGFKGSYSGTSGVHFNGIAVDEVFLMRAECAARLGKAMEAMKDLNMLLKNRWKANTFVPLTASTPEDALEIILIERRKELVGRGLRWYDLRRFNQDERLAHTLIRETNGKRYELPPNDPRYTFYIPQTVIDFTGMSQNAR